MGFNMGFIYPVFTRKLGAERPREAGRRIHDLDAEELRQIIEESGGWNSAWTGVLLGGQS